MKLDFQEIHHNYITRLVIFSVFLFKEMRKQENVYQESVRGFLKRRIPYDIDLSLSVGPKMSLDDQRESVINSLFNDDESRIMNLVVVHFKTGHNDVNIQINLNQEDKYQSYLYL